MEVATPEAGQCAQLPESGQSVVKSAKQLKKDARKKEKLERFQHKQAKLVKQQKQQPEGNSKCGPEEKAQLA